MEFLVILIIVVAGVVIAFKISESQKADAAWKEASSRLKLRYSQNGVFGTRSMTGKIDGYSASCETVKERKGNSATTHTRYALRFRKRRHGYTLTRAKALSGVATFFGSQDVEIGSEEFDRGVVIKAENPGDIRKFLTPARQTEVMRVLLAYPGARISNGKLSWKDKGVSTSAAQIESVFRRFVKLAEILSREGYVTPQPDVMPDSPAFREAVEREREELAREREELERGRALTEAIALAAKKKDEGKIHTLTPVFEPEPAAEWSEVPEPEVPEKDFETVRLHRFEPSHEPAAPVDPEAGPVYVDPRSGKVWQGASDAEDEAVSADEPEASAEPAPAEGATLERSSHAEVAAAAPTAMPASDSLARAPQSAPVELTLEERPLASSGGLPSQALSVDAPVEGEPIATHLAGQAESPVLDANDEDTAPSLDLEDVCEHLFAGNQIGMTVMRVFEEQYAGKRVRWKGKLDRVDDYYSDFVFGSGPGAKATLEIHEISDTFNTKKAKAILQVDAATGEALRARVGEIVPIEGKLVRCEPYMHTLFVASE